MQPDLVHEERLPILVRHGINPPCIPGRRAISALVFYDRLAKQTTAEAVVDGICGYPKTGSADRVADVIMPGVRSGVGFGGRVGFVAAKLRFGMDISWLNGRWVVVVDGRTRRQPPSKL